VIGIYLPSFASGMLAARYGWVSVYGALSGLYTLALVVLWRWLRTDPGTRRPPTRVPLSEAVRAGVRDPLLVLAALAALFAQAVVFGTVQALPMLLHGYHVSTGAVGYLQGAAIAAALLVARPKRLAHTSFGRLVPVVALIGAAIAGAFVWLSHVWLSHGEHSRAVLVGVAAGGALTFVTMELLKQWSQSVAQVQARQHAAAQHDYVRQALWLLLANVGALVGALWIAKLATTSPAHWLLAISVAAALFLSTTLGWYESQHRIHHYKGRHRADAARGRGSS
jgi:dipeptide/tripeptide permease